MARNSPELCVVLPAEVVGTLDLLMYVAMPLKREPRIIAARDFLIDLLGETAAPVATPKKRAARGGP